MYGEERATRCRYTVGTLVTSAFTKRAIRYSVFHTYATRLYYSGPLRGRKNSVGSHDGEGERTLLSWSRAVWIWLLGFGITNKYNE